MNDKLGRNITSSGTERKKLIPELRFPEFKNDGEWVEKKLGEVGGFVGGGTPNRSNSDFWIGDIPWISSSDIIENDIHNISISRFINKKAINHSATKLIPKGSILFVSRVGVGKLAVNKIELCTSQDFTNYIPKKILNYLIAYYFLSKKYLLQSLNQGTSIKGFTIKDLDNFIIQYPKNKQEQQKIAAFLSNLDELIDAHKQKLELLKQHKKGLMQKLFPQEGEKLPEWRFPEFQNDGEWVEKKLGEVLRSYKLGGNYKSNRIKNNYPLIKMGNIGRGNMNLNTLEYIDDSEIIDKRNLLKYGDLLFNTRNTLELVGKVSIWKNELPKAYYNSNLMKLSFDNNFFMNYLFNTEFGLKKIRSIATGTTSVAAIYTKDLLKIEVFIPTNPKEQQKIASFLSNLDELITAEAEKIEQLEGHKKGLMQRMFPVV